MKLRDEDQVTWWSWMRWLRGWDEYEKFGPWLVFITSNGAGTNHVILAKWCKQARKIVFCSVKKMQASKKDWFEEHGTYNTANKSHSTFTNQGRTLKFEKRKIICLVFLGIFYYDCWKFQYFTLPKFSTFFIFFLPSNFEN